MNNAAAGSSSKARVGSSQPSETSSKRKRGMFQKDLHYMMYGFSDDQNPLPETVSLVEDIVMEYVTDFVHKAQDVASVRGKLLTEDFLFLIQKDFPKRSRCAELLSMQEELKQARKAFEFEEEKLTSKRVREFLYASLLSFFSPCFCRVGTMWVSLWIVTVCNFCCWSFWNNAPLISTKLQS